MKKLSVSLLTAATVLSSVGGIGNSVYADEGNAKLSTNGEVTFKAPEDVVNPVNPGDGDQATGSAGSLVMSLIPNFIFGSHEITGVSGVYNLNRSNRLQVADRRGVGEDGKAQGWTVSVSATDFVKQNGKGKLQGASLLFNSGAVKALTTETGAAPKVVKNTVDSSTGATPVFAAQSDEGLGQWEATFADKDVQLNIPVQQAGTFTSTLTWSITNTPNV
ncbi:WxL domain-containing protein [Enterococcus faecalis]|uniref:WxL domain-containing protein n=1 Tax=Enterococcus faecalis TaxID=1351 RepID=UPI002DBB0CC4|nr:WxL domain-containing protein [Enterococcus faecalis]MEB7792122.1 WxL domain-containing protein [Enterococcus faecalis]MEB7810091.1 WxL domain-containing protein [Enterococcus faecalis]